MAHASIEDFDFIMGEFRKLGKIFPHIRTNYVERKLNSGSVIFHGGVIIIYNIYKRVQRLGNIKAKKGDCVLHQIINVSSSNASQVLQEFYKYVNTTVYLSVRADNERAIKFYLKNDMEEISDISWADGKIKGKVFVH